MTINEAKKKITTALKTERSVFFDGFIALEEDLDSLAELLVETADAAYKQGYFDSTKKQMKALGIV